MLGLPTMVVLSILVFPRAAEAVGNSPSIDDLDLGTVVLANVIFRHGDRTPIDPYPTDPYKNLTLWPTGWGQLTNIGKEQHLELGKWFRKRYADLLPQTYSKEDIQVRSTDVDRTLMSAASNLAGLYPPVGPQVWDSNVNWQPVPIHTMPETMDEILAGKKKCPKYDIELKRVKASEEIQEMNRHYAELFAYVSAYSGKEIHDVEGLEYVYNTLFIEHLYNFTLPEWTGSVFPKKMIQPAAKSFTLPAYNQELQRLKCGPLLGEIVRHMNKKSTGELSPDRKMFMYSGHDTTIANMLMTLGSFKPHTPQYTAAILFELRKTKDDTFIVTVWYRNATGAEPILLTIPGCTPDCPLDLFVNVTKPLVPESWERDCHLSLTFAGFCAGLGLPEIICFGLFGVLVLIVILVGCIHCRKQSSPYVYQRIPFTRDMT